MKSLFLSLTLLFASVALASNPVILQGVTATKGQVVTIVVETEPKFVYMFRLNEDIGPEDQITFDPDGVNPANQKLTVIVRDGALGELVSKQTITISESKE